MSRIRVIRYDEQIETPNYNWVQELASAGISLRPEKPVEPMSLNEIQGRIISERNDGKPLTIQKALALGESLGVQSLAELHAHVQGSYTAHIKAIESELEKNLPKGVDGTMSSYTRVAAALGSFPDEILLKISSPGQQGMDTKYYLVPTSLSKEGAVVFGDAEEIDIQAQFTPTIAEPYAKSPKKKVADKEASHEKMLAKDAAFFESIDRKRDRAEKRERKPRVTGKISGTEFMAGVKTAVESDAAPNPYIAKILSEIAVGTRRIGEIAESDFSTVYDLARANAGEVKNGRIIASCDCAMQSDLIFSCGEVAGGASNVFIRSAVLKRAVEAAKLAMESEGGFFVYSTHAVAVAQNGEDPEQAVAIAKTIEFDETTGAVTLPQIEFLENSDGAKRIIETAKMGKRYGISARFAHGSGAVHRDGLYGENVCLELKKVSLRGFDIVSKPALGLEKSFLYWL